MKCPLSFPGSRQSPWGFSGARKAVCKLAMFILLSLVTSVGKWSATTDHRIGNSLDLLAVCHLNPCAHNPEVAGSNPASATKNPLLVVRRGAVFRYAWQRENLARNRRANLCIYRIVVRFH